MKARRREKIQESDEEIPVARKTIINISFVLLILIFISPWIFIVYRKGTAGNMWGSITEFFNSSFICENGNPNPTTKPKDF